MNYIENGNFEDGTLTHWQVMKPPVTLEKDGERYHANFGRGAELIQSWNTADKPTLVTVSLEVRVINGSNQPTGMVQGILHSQGPAGPIAETFNINEYLGWQTFTKVVQLHGNTPDALELLVQPTASNIVQLRNISVIG